jgi:uncharacterized membrane protein YeaQ/YmgE (transglycosylase-associated protein family)
MNIMIWLIVGGLIGWGASVFMRTDAREGVFLNVVIGVVGAVLGGWFLGPLVGVSTLSQGNFSIPSLAVSLVGSIALLVMVNLVRRGSTANS